MRKTYDRKAMKPVMPPTDAEDIEWRDVVGFEGRYEVSNYGHVRTIPHYVDNHTGRILLKARLLRPNVLRKGYLQVTISDGDSRRHARQVHRLVAEAFIGRPADGRNQVNHKNGMKQDNRACNMEWTDNSGNQLHAWATGLQRPHYCGGGAERKRRIAMYDMQGRLEARFDSIRDAARAIGTKWPSGISGVLSTRPNKRYCKSCKGHRFEYID